MDPDPIDALNGDDGMRQRAGDNEVVERLFAAGRRFGRADHAIDQAEESRGSEDVGRHVPVASYGPRASEGANGGGSAFTNQLVGRVHPDAADEVNRHQVHASPQYTCGPRERNAVGTEVRDSFRRSLGEADAFASKDSATT